VPEIPFLNDLEPIDPATFTFDLNRPPRGEISFAQMSPIEARRLNTLLVRCAENLVLVAQPSDEIRDLVAKYARWGSDQEFIERPVEGENAVIHGTVLRVRERTVVG
jgi:hypothetical protein